MKNLVLVHSFRNQPWVQLLKLEILRWMLILSSSNKKNNRYVKSELLSLRFSVARGKNSPKAGRIIIAIVFICSCL